MNALLLSVVRLRARLQRSGPGCGRRLRSGIGGGMALGLVGLLAVIGSLPGLSRAAAATPASPAGWTTLWGDDFTGPRDSSPSPQNWLFDIGHSYPGGAENWGTGEVAAHTNDSANVSLDGAGNLRITPVRDAAGNWTSGRIETRRTDFQPQAGGTLRIEGRISLPDVTGPEAQGIWPAFWALGAPFRGVYTNWPEVGEIDVMENVNGENTVRGTLHCGVAPGGPCNEQDGIHGSRSGFSPTLQGGFHTFVVLNVTVGGVWPGPPTSATASGRSMLVDYVIVSSRGGNAATQVG
jgi:beta-glucanase (GH16 family)